MHIIPSYVLFTIFNTVTTPSFSHLGITTESFHSVRTPDFTAATMIGMSSFMVTQDSLVLSFCCS